MSVNFNSSGINGLNGINTPLSFEDIIPLEYENKILPEFPVDCLPKVIKEEVLQIANTTHTFPDMAAVEALGVLAVCLQGKYYVNPAVNHNEHLSLFVLVIAESGELKSPVMNQITQPIKDFEQEYNEQYKSERMKSRLARECLERRIKACQNKLERLIKRDAETEKLMLELQTELANTPVINEARYFTTDTTSEALVSLMQEYNGRFSVIATEGGIFDTIAGRYSNTVNIDVFLNGYSGDSMRVDRKGRESEYIEHPSLSVITSVQPKFLNEIITNSAFADRGLTARFLFCQPRSYIGERKRRNGFVYDDGIKERFKELIYSLMKIEYPESPHRLQFSEEAEMFLDAKFEENEQFLISPEGKLIRSWASKYLGNVYRIAGLLSVAEGSMEVISLDTAKRAFEIGEYFKAMALYVYIGAEKDAVNEKAQYVLDIICKERIESIKRSELVRKCRGRFFEKVADLQPILSYLEEHHYIRIEKPEREEQSAGRKPDYVVVINPETYRLNHNGIIRLT